MTGSGPAPGGRRGQLTTSGLRPGWTTGACATAAARAAYVGLVTGEFPDPVTVALPSDRQPAFALTCYGRDTGPDGTAVSATAAVTKDAGDDPDVTHGAVVRVRVRLNPAGAGVTYAAGPGVGTVTLPGLPLPVGEPAINPAPRAMIRANLAAAARELGQTLTDDPPDVHVEVGIDGGEDLARHTLNGRLGVLGGLSVLGTTGVVVPYSCSAWIDSIRRGVDVALAAGRRHLAACTGSTSERVARETYGLPELALLDMGDFAGAVLTYLRRHPCDRLTICGGVAKLSKLATGHLDLHSARSSIDTAHLAYLADLAARAGADVSTRDAIARSTTVLGAVHTAAAEGVPLGDAIAAAARDEARRVLREAPVVVDVLCIDRAGGVVGRAGPADA